MKTIRRPVFVKSMQQKLIRAAVYSSADQLRYESCSLPESTALIASEVVNFSSEHRLFVLNGQIVAHSEYADNVQEEGLLDAATMFLREFPTASAFVLDMGFLPGRGWAIVEANPVWGASLRGCPADKVLGCIAAATTAWQAVSV
jgi:hypothetical protein